jgi:hypothetical protein
VSAPNVRGILMSASSLRQRGSAAVLVAVALGASACGGSGSSAKSAAASSAATTSAAAAPSVTTTKIKATGGGSFCKNVATSLNNVGSAAAAVGAGPTSLKALTEKSLAESKAIVAMTPAAIKPDMIVLLGVSTAIDKALIAAHYDYTKIDPSVLAAVQGPKIQAASQHVLAYVKTTCGIDTLGAVTGK